MAITQILLAANNLPAPSSWADLTKPEYKGHVQMANPNSSGTAYTTLATMMQLIWRRWWI